MQKKNVKKYANALFLIVVFAVTMWAVFGGKDLEQILSFITTANPIYVALGIACVLLFVFGESVIIYYLMHTLGIKVKLYRCCLYSFIGFFYSCITPSASGGQPMQVIAMRKDKIPVAVSTVVLAIIAITYKAVLVIIGAVVMIWRPAGLMVYLKPVEWIIYVGMALNVVCIAVLLLLVFRHNTLKAMAFKVLALVNRIKPLKNMQSHTERLERVFGQYEGAADFYRTHKSVMLNVFAITFLQRFVLFFITYLTYISFNLSGHGMPLIVSLQSMISVAVDMLPLPGGMGISETMFIDIFTPIFGENLVLPGMVISRGLAFYTQILICGLMTVVSSFVFKRKKITENTEEVL